MIASLHGILRFVGKDHLIIETNGIGFMVYVPRPVLAAIGVPGDTVSLHTMLIVREDSLTLYGFETPEQRAIFTTLISVSGVGPRVAINLLSSATPDEIRGAVARKDTARFVRAPGIGKKMAERLVLELQGKLDLSDVPTSTTPVSPEVASLNNELTELLTSLGYSNAEAQAAVASLPADAPADIEARLRLALRSFGSA